MRQRRRGMLFALVLVALLVNLPIAHQLWSSWRLDTDGVLTTAEVVRTDVLKPETDPHFFVSFRYDLDLDPEQRVWPVEVDRAAHAQAQRTEMIEVRLLEGSVATYRVEGETHSNLGWIVIAVIDLLLLSLVLVVWRVRRFGPPLDGDGAEGGAGGPGGSGEDGPTDQYRPF